MRPMLAKSIASVGLMLAAMVLPATAEIQVPDTVDSGDRVDISITGASEGSEIELWGPVTQTSGGAKLLSRPIQGSVAVLPMDQPAGSYELRQVGPNGKVVDREAIDVSASPITLSAPEAVEASGAIDVTWKGPGNAGDQIQVIDPATGEVVARSDLSGDPTSHNVTSLIAPDYAGTYEVAYVTGTGAKLKTRSIAVGVDKEWIRSPLAVATGQSFEVQWKNSAPANKGVRISTRDGQVIDDKTGLVQVVDGEPMTTMIAPEKAGNYRIEVIDLRSGKILKTLPLDVDV